MFNDATNFFVISHYFSFFLSNFAEKFKQMKKYILDLTVSGVCRINDKYVLIKLTHAEKLPPMVPGQFVEVRVDGSPTTFLRRPISINFVDYDSNELWLLVAAIGDGTRRLAELKKGETLNCVLPLGRGFTIPEQRDARLLLVGGGVGVAPLLLHCFIWARLCVTAEWSPRSFLVPAAPQIYYSLTSSASMVVCSLPQKTVLLESTVL